jgi:hypothetical protein
MKIQFGFADLIGSLLSIHCRIKDSGFSRDRKIEGKDITFWTADNKD